MQSFSDWMSTRKAWFEAELLQSCPDALPQVFQAICRYPLAAGGKRFRPLLCIAACEAVGGRPEQALSSALALELVHTFSLVHDDLPSMDNDDMRRGKPTVHALHGEAVGLLAGDALLAEAFVVLGEAGASPALIVELARATGAAGMVAGQYFDITATPEINLEALTLLHRKKTGALILASVRMGALCGGATPEQLTQLSQYGEAVGLAFQLQDDVLDADQDTKAEGPPSFVKLLGLEGTQQRAQVELQTALQAIQGLPQPQILDALARFTVERSG